MYHLDQTNFSLFLQVVTDSVKGVKGNITISDTRNTSNMPFHDQHLIRILFPHSLKSQKQLIISYTAKGQFLELSLSCIQWSKGHCSQSCVYSFPSSLSPSCSTLSFLIPLYHSLSFSVLIHDPN